MGTGKTHWGKLWALQAGYSFVDLDAEIEKETGVSVADIFAGKGEDYFRQREATILRQMLGKEKTIIACGGGAPCFFNNMKWMNTNGTTVLLNAGPGFILQNIKKQTGTRPLLSGMSDEEIVSFIKTKLVERAFFYNQAHIITNAEHPGKHTFDEIFLFKR